MRTGVFEPSMSTGSRLTGRSEEPQLAHFIGRGVLMAKP